MHGQTLGNETSKIFSTSSDSISLRENIYSRKLRCVFFPGGMGGSSFQTRRNLHANQKAHPRFVFNNRVFQTYIAGMQWADKTRHEHETNIPHVINDAKRRNRSGEVVGVGGEFSQPELKRCNRPKTKCRPQNGHIRRRKPRQASWETETWTLVAFHGLLCLPITGIRRTSFFRHCRISFFRSPKTRFKR